MEPRALAPRNSQVFTLMPLTTSDDVVKVARSTSITNTVTQIAAPIAPIAPFVIPRAVKIVAAVLVGCGLLAGIICIWVIPFSHQNQHIRLDDWRQFTADFTDALNRARAANLITEREMLFYLRVFGKQSMALFASIGVDDMFTRAYVEREAHPKEFLDACIRHYSVIDDGSEV